MYKCVEKKKLSKAVEDDANNLSVSVKAMYIKIECNDFSHKIKWIEAYLQIIPTDFLGENSSNLTGAIPECKKSGESRTTNCVVVLRFDTNTKQE